MLFSLAGTGFAVIGGGQAPLPPVVSALLPSTTAPRQVDPLVTVRTVSAVDVFDAVGTVTGDVVRVRVVHLRSTAPCWQSESLDFARDVLQDKEVRLVLSTSARAADGRVPARVLLPGGQDFALGAVTAGAALAGTTEVDPGLLSAETDARAGRRGLWGNACAPSQARASAGESTTSTTSTSATPPKATTSVPPSASIDPTTTTTTTSPPADVQEDVHVGRTCAPEGAPGVTPNGRKVTCTRTALRGLRWVLR
jgi:hypothetical protein